MSEWWTYSLSDFLLFSPRTYYRLFELYNLAVWPWHVLPQNFLHGRRPTVQERLEPGRRVAPASS